MYRGLTTASGRRGIRLTFVFEHIFVLLLSLLLSSGQAVEANSGPKEKRPEAYPSTPRAVVEAFVRASLSGKVVAAEKARLNRNPNQERYKYYMRDSPDAFSWDCFDIGTGYGIKEVKKTKSRAVVIVQYRRLGRLCATYYITGAKKTLLEAAREIAKERLKKEEYNHLWYVTDDTQEVRYSLRKVNNSWKIESLANPTYISVSAAINELNFRMTDYPEVRKVTPTDEEKAEIRRVIGVLENHLVK